MKTTRAVFQGDASPIVHYEAYLRKIYIKFSKAITKNVLLNIRLQQSFIEHLLTPGAENIFFFFFFYF